MLAVRTGFKLMDDAGYFLSSVALFYTAKQA
jgi:hypothetical protein